MTTRGFVCACGRRLGSDVEPFRPVVCGVCRNRRAAARWAARPREPELGPLSMVVTAITAGAAVYVYRRLGLDRIEEDGP